jgi:predicted flap endonuclease-1-like 5' DNA nuclease
MTSVSQDGRSRSRALRGKTRAHLARLREDRLRKRQVETRDASRTPRFTLAGPGTTLPVDGPASTDVAPDNDVTRGNGPVAASAAAPAGDLRCVAAAATGDTAVAPQENPPNDDGMASPADDAILHDEAREQATEMSRVDVTHAMARRDTITPRAAPSGPHNSGRAPATEFAETPVTDEAETRADLTGLAEGPAMSGTRTDTVAIAHQDAEDHATPDDTSLGSIVNGAAAPESAPPATDANGTDRAPDAPASQAIPAAMSSEPVASDLSTLPGSGPGLVWLLGECGIRSLAELAAADPQKLSEQLGLVGQLLNLEHWIEFAKARA